MKYSNPMVVNAHVLRTEAAGLREHRVRRMLRQLHRVHARRTGIDRTPRNLR